VLNITDKLVLAIFIAPLPTAYRPTQNLLTLPKLPKVA